MIFTYWFGIEGEESEFYGEEFFVEVNTTEEEAKEKAKELAKIYFPDETIKCYGRVSQKVAEMMGLDTY